jgi:hypothetical protein
MAQVISNSGHDDMIVSTSIICNWDQDLLCAPASWIEELEEDGAFKANISSTVANYFSSTMQSSITMAAD